jgi:beta-glucosidase
VKGLKAGQEYNLEIRLNNADFIAGGSPFTCRGGIRLGGIRQVEGEQAITEAAQLAKDSDGAFLPLSYTIISHAFLPHVVVILVIGLNHE